MGSDKDEKNGWQEWRQHVLAEIKRLSNNQEKLEEKSTDYKLKTEVELSRLKVWSGVYGAAAGMIAALILREVISRW